MALIRLSNERVVGVDDALKAVPFFFIGTQKWTLSRNMIDIIILVRENIFVCILT